MFETLMTFRIVMFLLLLSIFVCWRVLKPKSSMGHFTALILKEIVMGAWHFVFGAKKVRVAKRRKKKWWRFWDG